MNDSSTSLPNGTPEKLHKVWFHNVMNIRSCKVIATHTGVSVKPGLWTGLDYGLDWTVDWTGLTKQLYTDSERCQGYNSLSPALPQVAFLLLSPRGIVFSISERSKVTCILNKLPQRWLWTTWTTPCGFCKG